MAGSRSTKRYGKSAEFAVAAFLSKHSDLVSVLPHDSYADVVFEWNNKLYRVQIKSTNVRRTESQGSYRFDLRKGGNNRTRHYPRGQQDLFALYCHPLEKIIFIADNRQNGCTYRHEDIVKIDTLESLEAAIQQVDNREKMEKLMSEKSPKTKGGA